jgi:tRNA(fMet)-specific endonuclease VapC
MSYHIAREKFWRGRDLWIGAHAMALDVTLATINAREFKRIAGLSVENWTK